MMSIFDLLKDEIEEEQKLEIVLRINHGNPAELHVTTMLVPLVADYENASGAMDHLPSKPGI